jgi:hypothetical protein
VEIDGVGGANDPVKHLKIALALSLSLSSGGAALSAIQQSTISFDGHLWRALAHNVSTGIAVVFTPAQSAWTPTDTQALSVAKKYVTTLPKSCRLRSDLRMNWRGRRWLFTFDCAAQKSN